MTASEHDVRPVSRTPVRPPALSLWTLVCWTCVGLLLGCAPQAEEKKPAGPPPTQITVTQARMVALDVTEDTLGTLEAVIDPKIGAEVAGRVVKVLARPGDKVRKGQLVCVLDDTDLAIQTRSDAAEIQRLEALLAQQERLVGRQQNLVGRGFISQNAVDDALAQRNALRAQLAAARARADAGQSNLGKARVLAPVDSEIETQIVAPGDYVKVGDPLFKFVSNKRLRAHLPFPEAAAAKMRRGLPVRITSPQAPGKTVEGEIDDIRPSVTESSRALDVIARFDNSQGLLSGGTINASVVVDRKLNVIVVPEQSVVLRPAGKVAYVVSDGRAQQRIVETGAKQGGVVEIVSGLAEGETVALDGAGFLTQGALVSIQERGKTVPVSAPARPQG
jgi:RND family efflux transporter MFP subunit